jgi:hypothetical protein
MDRRKMIKDYKNTLQPMGIVQVKNTMNDSVYLTASANTVGTINSIRFQLKMGSFFPSPALTEDLRDMGAESFVIEVLDELKPVEDPAYDYRDDLKALEAVWKEKLRQFLKYN